MDTVFADSEIIVITKKRPKLEHSINTNETAIIVKEPIEVKAKRFGIVDLWKIHNGKRYANVYPRRLL